MDLYALLLAFTIVGIVVLVVWTLSTWGTFRSRINAIALAADSDQREVMRRMAALPANDHIPDESDAEADGALRSMPVLLSSDFLASRRGGPLGLAWRELEQSLMMTSHGQALSRSPQDIFSPDLLYQKDVDLRRFEAYPNILVGTGLATTFVLLALTIGVGVNTLNASDTQSISAIVPLLKASALKFLTSIVGIGCSIFFIVVRNRGVLRAETALAELADELASALPQVSQQSLLADLVMQSVEQNRLTKARNEDMAAAVAASVRQELENGLVAALTPIADRMTDLSQRVAEVNAKQIEMMAAAFARDLGIAIEKYSRTLAEQLETAVTRFAEVPPAIEAAANAYAEAVDDSVLRMRTGADNAAEIYGGIETLLRDLTAAVAAADDRLNKSVQGFRGELEDGAEGLRMARQALVDALPVVDAMRQAAPAGAALNEAAKLFQRAGVEVVPALLAWQQGLAGLDTGLANVIDKIDALFERAAVDSGMPLAATLPPEPQSAVSPPEQPDSSVAPPTAGNPEIKAFAPPPASPEPPSSEAEGQP
ncbi:hypothetical protein [Sandarakinorhabdus rubra]|uniref:hypothetical protein n=1 Tax=Sandarakinorhabdus rubra TaxID=2672568 RepID=UPI0013DBDDDB|nr:hypothetical protein [Sandarakinorhabdus rubra]